jgi:hypothetical protein
VFDQGLLLLTISSPATRTVAVDPASGAVRWSCPGSVVPGPALFMYFDQGGAAIATISPATGREVWSSQQQALGTGAGMTRCCDSELRRGLGPGHGQPVGGGRVPAGRHQGVDLAPVP